jgi:hypothetical protein
MVEVTMAQQNIIGLNTVYVNGSSQFVSSNEGIEQKLFIVYDDTETGMTVIGELHYKIFFISNRLPVKHVLFQALWLSGWQI